MPTAIRFKHFQAHQRAVRSDAMHRFVINAAPNRRLAQDALSLRVCFEHLIEDRVADLIILGFVQNGVTVHAERNLFRLLREAASYNTR